MPQIEWSEAENEILRVRRAARIPARLIAQELGRTVGATYAQAAAIGAMVMERNVWSEAETARLVALHEAETPIANIALELDRTVSSVRWKLDDLGIGGTRVKFWSDAEDAALKKLVEGKRFKQLDLEQLATDLAGAAGAARRESSTIGGRIQALKLCEARPRWTKPMEAALKTAIESGTLEAFANTLGKTLSAVETKAYALGYLERKPQAYTEAEQKAIEDGIKNGDDLDVIAARIGRPVRGLREQAIAQGLVHRRVRRVLDDALRNEILGAAREGKESASQTANRLGWDYSVIVRVASEAGLTFPKIGRAKRVAPKAAAPRPVRPVVVRASRMVERKPARVVPVRAAKPAPALPRAKAAAKVAAKGPSVRAPARIVAPRPPRKVLMRRAGVFKYVTPAPASDMTDAIARFIAERGVTRPPASPADVMVRGLQGRGYSVVRAAENGWMVDGREHLGDLAALTAYAASRGVMQPAS